MFSLYYFTPFAYFTHRSQFYAAYNLLRYTYERDLEIQETGESTLPSIEDVSRVACS